jgi:hypothetical protein
MASASAVSNPCFAQAYLGGPPGVPASPSSENWDNSSLNWKNNPNNWQNSSENFQNTSQDWRNNPQKLGKQCAELQQQKWHLRP